MHYQNGGDYADKWSAFVRRPQPEDYNREGKVVGRPAGQIVINGRCKNSRPISISSMRRLPRNNAVRVVGFCGNVSLLFTKFTHHSAEIK